MTLLRFLFKGQLKPNIKSLLRLWVFWFLCLFVCIVIYAINYESKFGGFGVHIVRRVVDDLFFRAEWELWAILTGVAVLLTGIHYWILRLRRGDGRNRLAWKESTMICGVAAIAILGSWVSFQHLQVKIIHRLSLYQTELNDELKLLITRKEYAQAVVLMEKSMVDFRAAKEFLGDDVEMLDLAPSGISNLYTTCNFGWEHTSRHMPFGLRVFLQNDEYPRGALGVEMSASSDPVLRCFGYWFFNKADFLRYSYEQAEAGNEACYGFALWAAYAVDKDPIRACQIASKIWQDVDLRNRTTDEVYIEIGAKAEEKGHQLGKYEAEYRQALKCRQQYLLNPNRPQPSQLLYKALTRHGLDQERKNLELYDAKRRAKKKSP